MKIATIKEFSDRPMELARHKSVCVVGSQHAHIRTFLTNEECDKFALRFLEECQSAVTEGIVVRRGFTQFVLVTMQSIADLKGFVEGALNELCGDAPSRRAWFFELSGIEVGSERQVLQIIRELDERVLVLAEAEFGYAYRRDFK